MDFAGATCVVTGAASGIGRASARRFAEEGATVVLADLDLEAARVAAEAVGGIPAQVDVGDPTSIGTLIAESWDTHGGIDCFFSNAGIATGGGAEVIDAEWDRIWRINTMSHVWAARELVPRMRARGSGHLVSTSSAAGLLMAADSAPYTVTNHAAVAFAEWLSVAHGDLIDVSVLCPQGVQTPMVEALDPEARRLVAMDGILSPEDVAEAVVGALRERRFLILPHPRVAGYEEMKVADRDAWLAAMRRHVHGG
ncbi:MAG: SDR family oxidoreductase [Acidimicrobiia bacterium]|nr:SDR family oxidoreductase [Acidimicrobiia bacterium]